MDQHPINDPASAAPAGTPQAPDGDAATPAAAPAVTAQAAASAPEPAAPTIVQPDGAPHPHAADLPPTADTPPADAKKPDIAPEFELVEVVYRGKKWTVPKDRGQWDMNVQFEFEEGRRLRGLFILLGGSPENISATKAQVYAICRTNAEVDDFMDHCTEVLNKECVG